MKHELWSRTWRVRLRRRRLPAPLDLPVTTIVWKAQGPRRPGYALGLRSRARVGLWGGVCGALVLLLALAWLAAPVVHADDLDERVRQIASQLQCPVCQSVSVADSPAELARQMRGVIREKLERGETPEQIIQYFVDRYGEGVLLNPPKRGFALGAWLAPLALLLVGGWVVASFVRAHTRRAGAREAPDELELALTAELERYREAIRRELDDRLGELTR